MSANLGLLLAAACERYVRTLFARLGGVGFGHLTPSQAVTVMLIGDGVGTVTALAERLGMTGPAVSKICTALAAEGLLDRATDAADARSRRLTLTATGTAVLTAIQEAARDAEAEWIAKVGADTVETVRVALTAYTEPDQAQPAPAVRIRFT